MKTKIKIIMTKKRKIKSKLFKKILIILFLLLVNAYIWGVIYYQISANWSVTITAVANSDNSSGSPVRQSDSLKQSQIATAQDTGGRVASSEDLIKKYFKKDWKIAYAIMKAESQGDAGRIGDKHLITKNQETKELVGDSVGLFQIRTGDKNWNRCARNGMRCKEFRKKLKNPEFNVKYAKNIYDRWGWRAWSSYTNGSYKKYYN